MVSLKILCRKRVYLDANVFIYAMEQLEPWCHVAQSLLTMIDHGDMQCITSESTLAECLIKPIRRNQPENVLAFERAFEPEDNFEVLPIGRPILKQAAEFRALTALKLPDAIHAATAVVGGCSVIVTNVSGFSPMKAMPVILLSTLEG